jgi:DHA1 family multidrug resistance protein-like MFS transporter
MLRGDVMVNKKQSDFFQVVVVLLVYFVQGIIHNLGHPVTPALITSLNISDYYFGLYFAAMSFGLLIGAPLWGVLADLSKKKYYIFFGLLVYSIGQILFGFGTNANLMILYRFLSGFGVSASITLLVSHLVEHTSDEKRKVYLGWYQGVFVLGSSLGYYIAGFLTESDFFTEVLHTGDYRNIFLIQGVLNMFHALIIFTFLVEKKQNTTSEKSGFLSSMKKLTTLDKRLFLFLLSLTFFSLGTIVVSKFIEVFMNDEGYLPRDIGDFVGTTGIVSFITMILIVPVTIKIKKDFNIMLFIQLFSAVIIFIVFKQSNIMLWLYTGFMLYVVLKTLYSPLEQHYIASFAEGDKYSSILGVRQSFLSIGLVLGPIIGGFLYDFNPLYAFDFAVIMFLIGFLLLFVMGRVFNKEN